MYVRNAFCIGLCVRKAKLVLFASFPKTLNNGQRKGVENVVCLVKFPLCLNANCSLLLEFIVLWQQTKRSQFWHTSLFLLRQEAPLHRKEVAREHRRVYLLIKIRTRFIIV